jgi:PAS domain S-box-containing protein
MAESMPQKIFTARPGGGVDYLNQQWTACSTAPLSELFDWGWTRLIHPEDLEKTLQSWRHALETRQPHEVEHRIQSAGGEYRWHLTRARPMFDGNGNILLWIGSSTDIEDRKQAEFRLEKVVAERTAALRETVAELESFSYSISHDMRAPLRAMQQYAQVLIEEQRERLTPEGVSHLERIASAAARLDQLIRDILTYSRVTRENLVLAPVDLEKLVRELIEQSPALQNPARVEIQGALAPVLGHEAAVMQCISNLILNAVKFVPPGRAPHVRIWTEPRGDFVRLWVEDNGIGISPENQKRVFDIFVRVHPQSAYPGTGIGLSIVRKAAMKMGGTVGVESELGKGSRFWIELRKPQL